jgi:hypothetical protein
MFKRLFWLFVGAGFGFGMSFWLTRMVKQTVERYTPERVGNDVAGALRAFGDDLRAAVADGRQAMREQEAALRADLARRPPRGGPIGVRPADVRPIDIRPAEIRQIDIR